MGRRQTTGRHDQIRRWLEQLQQALASPDVDSSDEAGSNLRLTMSLDASCCAQGHADVIYLAAECPVCQVRRRAGYSEKWCERCQEITAHVGGLHINATCVQCLSDQQPGEMPRIRRQTWRVQ